MEEIKNETNNEHGKTLISWEFLEYVKYPRTIGWYIGFVLIFAGLLLYAILTKNFLFAVIIVMFSAIILLYRTREPAKIKFSIVEDGIEIGTKFYPWEDIKNFWILYNPPEVKKVYFDFKGWKPTLPIPLENQNPVKVREILLQYLKEDLKRESEPAGDELERLLKI
jgi:hypothetical protein